MFKIEFHDLNTTSVTVVLRVKSHHLQQQVLFVRLICHYLSVKINLWTGACEGTLACSTCHLIFKPDQYEQIHEKPTDEELDMLDLAFGLSDT